AHVENFSTHPIAVSLKNAYKEMDDLSDNCEIKNIEELPGLGMKALVNNEIIYVGNSKLMGTINIDPGKCHRVGTMVHIATEKEYLGHIVISDKIKDDAKVTIEQLKGKNIKPVMNGRGISIISTSKGVMSGPVAKKSGLGGELICEIW
ncbi:30S ribosomal protein S8, partial [bacterium]|nr:30S ribosomal protein S8 [bacterium]